MTLENALHYFEKLILKGGKKSEIKVFKDFTRILSTLQQRKLSPAEINAIEKELNYLQLNAMPIQKKKYFRKALKDFENFLRETFSLTTVDYYTKKGTALGMTFGLLFGTVFLSNYDRSMGTALGMSIGMFAGLLIGRNMDTKALSAGLTV